MARNPTAVKPLVKQANDYNKSLRNSFLGNYHTTIQRKLAKASAVKQALIYLDEGYTEFVAQDVPGVRTGLIQTHLDRISSYNRQKMIQTFQSALGVDIRAMLLEPEVREYIKGKVIENADLVRLVPERGKARLAKKIADTFEDAPFDEYELKKVMRQEFTYDGYALRRVTRDQTSKINGNLTEMRHKQCGITHFIWRTSGDERVRPEHQVREGVMYSYAQADELPGQAIQCRCVAQPAVDKKSIKKIDSDEVIPEPVPQAIKPLPPSTDLPNARTWADVDSLAGQRTSLEVSYHEESWWDINSLAARVAGKSKPLSEVRQNPRKGAYHYQRHIEMGEYPVNEVRGQGVWRHEFGHHIDYDLGAKYQIRPPKKGLRNKFGDRPMSLTEPFQKARKADSKRMINGSKNSDALDARNKEFSEIASAAVRRKELDDLATRLDLPVDDLNQYMEYFSYFKAEGLTQLDKDVLMHRLLIGLEEGDVQGVLDAFFRQNWYTLELAKDRDKYERMYSALMKVWEGNLNALSDTADALSNGRVTSVFRHSTSYYSQRGASYRLSEAFANGVQANGAGRTADKIYQLMFPEYHKELIKVLKRELGIVDTDAGEMVLGALKVDAERLQRVTNTIQIIANDEAWVRIHNLIPLAKDGVVELGYPARKVLVEAMEEIKSLGDEYIGKNSLETFDNMLKELRDSLDDIAVKADDVLDIASETKYIDDMVASISQKQSSIDVDDFVDKYRDEIVKAGDDGVFAADEVSQVVAHLDEISPPKLLDDLDEAPVPESAAPRLESPRVRLEPEVERLDLKDYNKQRIVREIDDPDSWWQKAIDDDRGVYSADEVAEAKNHKAKIQAAFSDLDADVQKFAKIDDVAEALAETFSETNTAQYMAIRAKDITRAIKDNEFKTYAQTKKGGSKITVDERFARERDMFHLDADDIKPENMDNLPKYGFVSDADQIATDKIVGIGYGENYVKFKPSVRAKSTMTMDDSLDGNKAGYKINPAVPMNEIDSELLASWAMRRSEGSIDDYMTKKLAKWGETKYRGDLEDVFYSSYTETQIYGKLTLADVDTILVESKSQAVKLRKALDKAGFEDVKIGTSGQNERLKHIWEDTDPTDSHSFSPKDIDALGDKYVDTIFVHHAHYITDDLYDFDVPPSIRDIRIKIIDAGGPSRQIYDVPMPDKREFLKEYARLAALKEEGGLPKDFYKRYKVNQAGFTDDVLDDQLLEAYPKGGLKTRDLTHEEITGKPAPKPKVEVEPDVPT